MSSPEPTSGGVIFDIGYRHFEGRRVDRRGITLALYVESLRGAFGLGRSARSKIMPFALLAIAVVPALIIAVVASVAKFKTLPLGYVGYLTAITTLVALYVAGQAPAAVSRDLRFRTVSLYFSRPIGRMDYVRAKYAALASAVLIFTAVPLLTLYAGALLASLPFWAQTRGVLVALAEAVLLAVVISGVSLVIASVTIRRGLGVAAVIAVLVISGGVQSALQALGAQQGSTALAGYSGLVDPFSVVLGVVVWAFSADPGAGPRPPGAVGGLVYLAELLVLVAASYAGLSYRYRKVTVS